MTVALPHGLQVVRGPGPQLRHIRVDGARVFDMIGLTLRGPDWATMDAAPTPRLDQWRYVVGDVTVDARFHVDEQPDGLQIRCALRARESVHVSRAGLVVLHALELAHRPMQVVADGQPRSVLLDENIEPWPLCTDVQSMTIQLATALVEVRFGDDRYETEDHRNWCDAGWKSYSPPLSAPRPFVLPAGQTLEHTIDIAVRRRATVRRPTAPRPASTAGRPTRGPARSSSDPEATRVTVLSANDRQLPHLGWGVGTNVTEAAAAFVAPDHFLHAEIVDGPSAGHRWEQIRAQTLAYGVRLRLTLLATLPQLPNWSDRLAEPEIDSVCVINPLSHTSTSELRSALRPLLRKGTTILGGTRGYLAELLRCNDDLRNADAMQFSISAEVHHHDDESVMDTIRAVPHVVAAARRAAGGRPLVITPITLAQRMSVQRPADEVLAPWSPRVSADPRSGEPFGAAWVVGAMAGVAGTDAVAWFSLEPGHGLLRPDGTATPAGTLLGSLAGLRHPRHLECLVGDRRRIAALAVRHDRGLSLWLANLTPAPRQVSLTIGNRTIRRKLDAYAVETLVQQQLN